jgi:transposase
MVQSDGQLDFFNEIELEADRQAEEEFSYETEPEETEKEKKKRKPRTLRKELFKGLKVVDEEPIELPKEKQFCGECGARMIPMGPKLVREVLKYTPAKLELHCIYVQTYICPECKEHGEKNTIKNANAPEALIPHSYAGETVAAHAMYQKFVNAVPLYRQEKDWEQMGAFLSRGTLGRWIKICSDEYFVPIYEYFHRLLLGRQFAMADETRLQVLKEPERNPATDSLMWLFRSGEDGLPPIILYRYTETRANPHVPGLTLTIFCGCERVAIVDMNSLPSGMLTKRWGSSSRSTVDVNELMALRKTTCVMLGFYFRVTSRTKL